MRDCTVIQPELSAYIDGELTSAQREAVEAHLALCSRCRQELEELKTLTAGVAALPKLRPAPQFLDEVRRKIARGDRPEPVTWQDYLFKPVWLKVPLELAAVLAIAIFVMRSERPVTVQEFGSGEMAKTEEFENQQNAATQKPTEEPQRATEAKPARAEQPVSPAAALGGEMANTSSGESTPSIVAQATTATEAEPVTAIAPMPAEADGQLPGSLGKNGSAPRAVSGKAMVQTRPKVVARKAIAGGSTIVPAPTPPDISEVAQSFGIDRSKLGDVMIVRDRGFNDVQGRAEQLAVKCNGRVIPIPQIKDSTGQVFLVELPPEYVASFKLALMQSSESLLWTTGVTSDENLRVLTNATSLVLTSSTPAAGELTGSRSTNATFSGLGQLALTNDVKARQAAMAVVEILVVPPLGVTGTNATPASVSPSN